MPKKPIENIVKSLLAERKGVEKISRAAFLYLEPHKETKDFAQCGTCMMHTGKHKTCTIHGKDIEITKEMSCGFYIAGAPHEDMAGKEMPAVTPKESGLYDGKVRCENCTHANKQTLTCKLYSELNAELPQVFELDENIKAKGCCNAFTKRSGK